MYHRHSYWSDVYILRQTFFIQFISSFPSIHFNAFFLKLFLLLAALEVVTLMHKGPKFGAEYWYFSTC